MREILFFTLLYLVSPSAFATCGDHVQVGRVYANPELTTDVLEAMTGRSITFGKQEGLLLAASRGQLTVEMLVLRDGKVMSYDFSAFDPRLTIEVKNDLPKVIADADGKYAARRFSWRVDSGLCGALRDKVKPNQSIKMIYLEADNRTWQKAEGTLEIPDPEDQVSAALMGSPSCFRLTGANGVHSVNARRVVRVYL